MYPSHEQLPRQTEYTHAIQKYMTSDRMSKRTHAQLPSSFRFVSCRIVVVFRVSCGVLFGLLSLLLCYVVFYCLMSCVFTVCTWSNTSQCSWCRAAISHKNARARFKSFSWREPTSYRDNNITCHDMRHGWDGITRTNQHLATTWIWQRNKQYVSIPPIHSRSSDVHVVLHPFCHVLFSCSPRCGCLCLTSPSILVPSTTSNITNTTFLFLMICSVASNMDAIARVLESITNNNIWHSSFARASFWINSGCQS